MGILSIFLRDLGREFKERVLDGGLFGGLTRWVGILSIFLRDLGREFKERVLDGGLFGD